MRDLIQFCRRLWGVCKSVAALLQTCLLVFRVAWSPLICMLPTSAVSLLLTQLSLGRLLGLRASPADAWSGSLLLSALGCCSAAVGCQVDTQHPARPFWSGKSGVEESIGSRGENDSAVAFTRAIECTRLSVTEKWGEIHVFLDAVGYQMTGKLSHLHSISKAFLELFSHVMGCRHWECM